MQLNTDDNNSQVRSTQCYAEIFSRRQYVYVYYSSCWLMNGTFSVNTTGVSLLETVEACKKSSLNVFLPFRFIIIYSNAYKII